MGFVLGAAIEEAFHEEMAALVPIAVVIPTFARGNRVLKTLERIGACDPRPAEIWIHVDASDGKLETELARSFPSVRVLSSSIRIGPGGGRHRCLEACVSPYAVSFDDDSYPLDVDFFSQVDELFSANPEAAVIGARIWHRYQTAEARAVKLVPKPSFTGCGHAIRLRAYRMTRGYMPLPVAYAMEEVDLALHLFAQGWKIYESATLRVFHDTELDHHQSVETTAGVISNVALFAFLNYPLRWWGRGVLQIGNMIWFCIKRGRVKGILPGLIRIPGTCLSFRSYRSPLPAPVVARFLHARRVDSHAKPYSQ